MPRRAGRRAIKDLALQRIRIALDFAFKIHREYPEYAVRAVKQAQRIAQKARVRIPTRLRRRFCRKCGTPFIGPEQFSVRVRDNRATHVVVKCRVCGFTRRFYAKK